MLEKLITKIFGNKHEKDRKRILPIVDSINEVYDQYHTLTDTELQAKTTEFKARIETGTAEI